MGGGRGGCSVDAAEVWHPGFEGELQAEGCMALSQMTLAGLLPVPLLLLLLTVARLNLRAGWLPACTMIVMLLASVSGTSTGQRQGLCCPAHRNCDTHECT